jgi:ABC-2 type transport system permease protein
MQPIFDLALKDILQILRDRMSFLFLVFMPVVFTLLFGFAFGSPSGPADTRPVVGLLDQDHSALSAALVTILQSSTSLRLDASAAADPTALDAMVANGKLSAALIVPAGFASSALAPVPARLTLIASPASPAASDIQAGADRLLSALQSASAGGASSETALAQAAAAARQPAAPPAAPEQPAPAMLPVAQTAPGMMLQFGIAGLLTAAQVVVAERKSRCLQRLLTTRLARWQILMGHYVSIFAVTFVQFMLLIVFGQLVMHLDYLRQPLATLLMAFTSALFIAGLGLLIGALAKSDEQAIIFALLPMFVFAGLGGAWVPLEATAPTFQLIGHLTPVAWALDGFKDILVRGLGLAAVALPAAALLGYAVLFCGLAVWKFKFE